MIIYVCIHSLELTINITAMINLFDSLTRGRRKKNGLKLKKSDSGEWSVKKGYQTLYIGTREKCEFFMSQGQIW